MVESKHTVFGQLIEGEATLEDIANTKVGAQDKPVHDVVIESIDVEIIIDYEQIFRIDG